VVSRLSSPRKRHISTEWDSVVDIFILVVLACIVAAFVSSVDRQLTRYCFSNTEIFSTSILTSRRQIVAGVSKPHLTSNVRDNELRLKVMEKDDGIGKETTE